MSNDNTLILAAVAVGAYMLMTKKAKDKAAKDKAAGTKPSQAGAGSATLGQYWTNLLGPLVGDAVKNGTFTYDSWSGSALVQQQQAADAAQLAGFVAPANAPTADDSTYWGIE